MSINLNFSEAVYYPESVFPPEKIDLTQILSALLGATNAIARYDQMLKNMHNSEILLAPLRNQEAVISSRMEGTVSTMDEILQYEADYPEDEYSADVRSDIIETVLYQRTLKNAQKAMEEGYPLSKSLLKTMHQQLLSFGRGANKSPGEFKKEQNYIADTLSRKILFVPISPEKLESGLDRLFDYIHQNTDPVLLKTAVTHLEFEALHPFQDGNGRIGRMLITLMLWNAHTLSAPHFYISGYLEENKNRYIDLMRNVSQTGDWNEWAVFFLNAIEHQSERNLNIAENIRALYEEMKTEFSEILSSKHSLAVLDFVFTYPVFRNSTLSKETGISTATANRFTKALQEKGILTLAEEASGRKSARYTFEHLMNLVRV
ncbi:Filamentation induced by cAMP protein Fic [Bibersteinia trehalosi USDA-ARS-USMARC-188]|uniref:Protein adenylyltransferase n=2 Tax=Bibersteinia trehalosi TaxID=47735 RepID=A0A4V7I783_BIBTR|nr:Fic family protein [Bibersteinia trehalosi]AHG80839.1 Filamentation induced by cAMP protein Fic [Bibersteinia trehalosi USDA-ARS-USMARC-188]